MTSNAMLTQHNVHSHLWKKNMEIFLFKQIITKISNQKAIKILILKIAYKNYAKFHTNVSVKNQKMP